jgi:hypothetical protein
MRLLLPRVLGPAVAMFALAALPAQTPPSADSILADAQAAANHRAVFVVFHASW